MISAKDTQVRADVRHVLDALGIGYRRREQQGHAELTARCPLGTHPDKDPSWSMREQPGDEKNGVWHCYGCKCGGDLLNLVMRLRDYDFKTALGYVQGFETNFRRCATEDYSKSFESYFPQEIRMPHGVWGIENGSECMRYLAGRDFGREEIDRYGLLDWGWRHRLFVPVTRHGNLIHWVARSYRNENPKALTPTGNTVGSLWGLFGLDQVDRTNPEIHLTESWSSGIRVGQAGFPNPLGLCGSEITEQQVQDLSWAKRITIWKEGDVAGATMDECVRNWLGPGRDVGTVDMPAEKDPENFASGELVKFFDRRR